MSFTSGRGDGRNRNGSGRRRQGRSLGAPSGNSRHVDVGLTPGDTNASREPVKDRGRRAEPRGGTPVPSDRSASVDKNEPSRPEYDRAKEIVLRQLTAAARSRHELEEKLRAKEIPEETIAEILDKYEGLGLVDDQQFAEMFVRSRAMSRKLAKPALRRELAHKGITGEMAEEALSQRSDDDERSDAADLVRKKLKPSVDLTDRAARDKELRRLASMLARRGYAPGLAFEVVRSELSSVSSAGTDQDGAGDEEFIEAFDELP